MLVNIRVLSLKDKWPPTPKESEEIQNETRPATSLEEFYLMLKPTFNIEVTTNIIQPSLLHEILLTLTELNIDNIEHTPRKTSLAVIQSTTFLLVTKQGGSLYLYIPNVKLQ